MQINKTNMKEKHPLPGSLTELCDLMKERRNFDAEAFLIKKRDAVNKFFRDNGLDSAVVGLSGGVDSAVTLMLLLSASDMYGSPIKKVLAVIAPISNNGTTGQSEAAEKAIRLYKKYMHVDTLDVVYCDLKNAAFELVHSCKTIWFDDRSGMIDDTMLQGTEKPNAWVIGQMDSVLRTPLFYMQAARLQAEGLKSLVVGTTNRDEGSYIGFFGKASDAMVDLQPIADIHKSEVYQLATLLGVTEEIISEKPRGDVWDNRVDEEMIGAPYSFLEMYLNLKMCNIITIQDIISTLGQNNVKDIDMFLKYSRAIEKLHNTNVHKYKVGSPAHFIDVMPRKVPGGW